MTETMRSRLSVRKMAVTAVMAAVICVLGPLSIPIGPVPVSLTNLAIYIAVYVLGAFQGTLSLLIYLLIGLAGLPVFSGFAGGPEKLFGPTGGYLIGFIPLAVISGLLVERYAEKRLISFFALVLGTAVCYAFGTLWLSYQSGLDLRAALFAGVIPFIPVDLVKVVLVTGFGPRVRKRLLQAGLTGRNYGR